MRIVAEGSGRAGRGDAVREAMGNSIKTPRETIGYRIKDNREEEVGRKPARGRIREGVDSFRVAGCRVVRFAA